jgi:hypothetical protein
MKNLILSLSTILFLAGGTSNAQCIGGTNGGAITPNTTWQTINVNGGNFYTFTATAGTVYYFSFCSSPGGGSSIYDTQITILNSFGNPVTDGFSEDFCIFNAYIAWIAPVNGTFRVLVSRYNCLAQTNMGSLAYRSLTPAACPAGLGSGVTNVASLPYNSGSTSTNGQANDLTSANHNYCGSANDYSGEDRVYVFTPSTGGTVTFNLNTSANRVTMALHEGCPLTGNISTCIASTNGNGNRTFSACLKQNVTYYLIIDSRSPTNNFSFTLSISAPVSAGSCSVGTTVNVASLPYSSSGRSTCGQGNDITTTNTIPCGNSTYRSGQDEVFTFTPAASGNITITLSSANAYTAMFLYEGCPSNSFCAGSGNACVNTETGASGNKSMCATVTAGRTYYLLIDSWGGCINYNISITAPAVNLAGATCANPVIIASLPFSLNHESTACMGDDYNNYSVVTCASLYESGEDKVYRYVATGPECISIALSSASTNFIGWQVYRGCPGTAGSVCIASSGGAYAGVVTGSATLPVADTYFIVVDTWANPRNAQYNIAINSYGSSVPNDLPCNAVSVPIGATVSGDNNCSSGASEPASPACWTNPNVMNTVWYSFVVPASGNVIIRTAPGSLRNTQIAAYSGNCSGTLTLLGCNNDASSCGSTTTPMSQLSLTGLTAGSTCLVAIDGTGAFTGTFGIMVADAATGIPPSFAQDCSAPLPVCNDTIAVGDPGFQSFGNRCDFPGGGTNCITSGERGSAWYEIAIGANGNLEFTIVPNDWQGAPSVEATDYDFVMWKTAGTGAVSCAQIATGATPIRCNYDYLGVTGLFGATNGTAPTQYPGFGTAFNAQLPVVAGERYMLVISNFSNSVSGFTLNFSAGSPVNYTPNPSTVFWTGVADNDWFKPVNWGGCVVPDCNTNATILAASANQPLINGNGAACRSLNIDAGATLTISSNRELQVCGDFINNGFFNAQSGSNVLFNSNVNQVVNGSVTGSNDFQNFTVSKTAGILTFEQNADISGNFSITNATSNVNGNGRYLKVAGNFSNLNGIFTAGTNGTLEFNGSAPQTYQNSSDLERVLTNHNGSGITLLSNMNISTTGALQLTAGRIITNSLEVNVKNTTSGAVSTGNTSSFVQGFLRRSLPAVSGQARSLDFPVGHASAGYQRINISTYAGNDPAIGSLRVHFETYSPAPPAALGADPSCPIDFNVGALDNGFWNVLPQGGGTADMHITLYNTNYTNASTAFTVMRNVNNTGWSIPPIVSGGCGTTPVSAVLRNGVGNSFSAGVNTAFGTAQGSSALPVDLLTLEAFALDGSIEVRWTTASETNNKGFEVQRSEDTQQFNTIGWVEGRGTRNELSQYRFDDNQVVSGKVYYYRLRQLDYDGQYSFSKVVAAKLTASGAVIFEAFPNPYAEVTSLKYILSRPSIITIEIVDAGGRMVKRFQQGLQDAGMYTLPWSGKQMGLSKGIYIANLWCDNARYQLRLTEN